MPHQPIYIRYSEGSIYGQIQHCDSDAKFFTAVVLVDACEYERCASILATSYLTPAELALVTYWASIHSLLSWPSRLLSWPSRQAGGHGILEMG